MRGQHRAGLNVQQAGQDGSSARRQVRSQMLSHQAKRSREYVREHKIEFLAAPDSGSLPAVPQTYP